MATVTPARAQQLFALCNSQLCCPGSAPAPCIPFLYPDDGCWARAHEMCRLMIADGAQPAKIWICGSLHVISANSPQLPWRAACHVDWGWHVAPTLQVSTSNGVETWAVDPSLFAQAVPQATWVGVQGEPNPTLVTTGDDVYRFWPRPCLGNTTTTDPAYTQTAADLQYYRNQLKLRSAGPDGPPPYFACLVQPPGVQWFGSLAPNQTLRWFTWGWPAEWHVVWTVMPLTECPGGPQITWTTEVERASDAQSTYWITVTNLTSDPVKFEGRYDVLSY